VEKYFSTHINFLLDFSTFALALESTSTFYLTIVELLLALASTRHSHHIKYAP